MSRRWQASFKVNSDLPLPVIVQPWLGVVLKVRGVVTVQGAKESRRRTPVVTWAGSGKYHHFGLPETVELVKTKWSASLVYGPRSNAELWELAVRMCKCDGVSLGVEEVVD